eukprot:355336-Pelagomonas_calceolata.AAC.3
MPPELIEDGKVYQQGDVYAFGIMMWEVGCLQASSTASTRYYIIHSSGVLHKEACRWCMLQDDMFTFRLSMGQHRALLLVCV